MARFAEAAVDHFPSDANASISAFLGPNVVNSRNFAICFRSDEVPSLDKMTYLSLGASIGRLGSNILVALTLIAVSANGPGATSQLLP